MCHFYDISAQKKKQQLETQKKVIFETPQYTQTQADIHAEKDRQADRQTDRQNLNSV